MRFVPDPRDILTALPRMFGLLDSVEALIDRIETTRQSADALIVRIGGTVDRLEPSLTTLQPTLERLAATTSPAEVDALVGLVDQLPQLQQSVQRDVLPILEGMGSVAPDLHDLLNVSRELNEMLSKIPGLNRLRDDE